MKLLTCNIEYCLYWPKYWYWLLAMLTNRHYILLGSTEIVCWIVLTGECHDSKEKKGLLP